MGGSFNGGSVPITFSESLRLDGTSFTSTSGTMYCYNYFTFTSGSFSHNNGTVIIYKGTETTTAIGGTSNAASTLTLYNVEFAAPSENSIFSFRNITVVVMNEMKLTGQYHLLLNTNSACTIELQGNLISSNTAAVGGGDVLILVNGTGSQSITDNHGTAETGKLPNIKISKSSGTLSLYGAISLGGSTTWEYMNGTVNEGTARIICTYSNTLYNHSGSTMKYNKLEMVGDGGTHTITGKIMVTDTFSTSGSGNCVVNGDTLELQGNLVWNNSASASGGNVIYKFSGTSEQIISGTVAVPFSKIKLVKTSGDIILQTSINISSELNFLSGYIIGDTINWVIFKHGASAIGSSENSFVKGTVKKIGNSSFVFPVGKDTIFNPIAITAPSSSTDAFTAEYFNFTQPHGFNKDSLTYLSGCEYWNVQRTTGSSNVKVTLNWNSTSCDIYTLSTLRIGRWDGSKWNNTGPVTTTGNTTAGTIQTASNQIAFGNFILAKRSPALTANAGDNATINLGSAATLGGSPAATGGVPPYSYLWTPDYALSSVTVANPTTRPFWTYTYYLEVTDADQSSDLDSVTITVNGFDLKTATRFPLLAGDSLIANNSVQVTGAVGIRQTLSGQVIASDSILINTSTSNLANRHLDTAIQKIDNLTATSLSSTLGGQTITEGVHRISGNATLSGNLTLQGGAYSYIVIDIGGNLTVSDSATVTLNGIEWDQVYIRVGNMTINGAAVLQGIYLMSGNFNGTVSGGDYWLQAKGDLKGSYAALKSPLVMATTGAKRAIDNYFGYNTSNVIQEYGLGDSPWIENMVTTLTGGFGKVPLLHTDVLRYPGGAEANWSRWQSGWLRGYDNPAYNSPIEDKNPGALEPVFDNLPLPSHCTDGLPWDLKTKLYRPNYMTSFETTIAGSASFPLFDINMLSSDLGTEIGGLFEAHCNGLAVKYIELGNEFALDGKEAGKLYANGYDYAERAQLASQQIKKYFPSAKTCIVSTNSKPGETRRNNWNNEILDYLNYLEDENEEMAFDAVSFHVYPSLMLDEEFIDCDLDSYVCGLCDPLLYPKLMGNILSTPFLTLEDLESYDLSGLDENEKQPEFEICDESPFPLEAWITEFNQEDDKYDFHGRWAHGLFTSLMALLFLEREDVTKATCFELLHTANRSVVFNSEKALTTNNTICNATPTLPDTEEWGLGAAGEALRYVGLATKNAYSAQELSFALVPSITDVNGNTKPGLYGWVFSHSGITAPYAASDSNWAVVLNLTGTEYYVQTYNLFPLGGEAFTLYDEPLAFITGAGGELTEQTAPLSTAKNAKLSLKPYSITLIRGGNMNKLGIPKIQVTSTTACKFGEVYLSISCTGATSFQISPAVACMQNLPTLLALVNPAGTITYTIAAFKGSQMTTATQLITVAAILNSAPVITGAPDCPGDPITLNANYTPSGLLYNWYPTPDYLTTWDDEEITVNPPEDFTYHLNVTDGNCFCGLQDVAVNMHDSAEAGPDIYICNNPEKPVILGGGISYTPGTIIWTEGPGDSNPPLLSSYTTAQPTIVDSDPLHLPSGDYSWILEVNYGGCILKDTVNVYINECCTTTQTGAAVFDPYDADYGGNYLTTSFLWEHFEDAYTTSYNLKCSGAPSLVDGIVNFPYKIIINGLLYVDKTFAFANCDIKLGPDARIIVEPNQQLFIKSCSLTACSATEMWHGIEIVGNLNEDPGLEITEACTSLVDLVIQDAKVPVYAAKDSRLSIIGCTFDKNHEGIVVENYRFALKDEIEGNTFEKSGSPISNDIDPDTAIAFNNVSSTDGSNGFGSVRDNTITDYDYGIFAKSTGLVTSGNVIDRVKYGISICFKFDGKIVARECTIDNFEEGIILSKLAGAKVSIIDNDIGTLTTTPVTGSDGIVISGNNTVLHDMTVRRNTIREFTDHGIIAYGTNTLKIWDNDIEFTEDGTGERTFGIKLSGAKSATVTENNILSSADADDKVAISVDKSPDCVVHCNQTDLTQIGLESIFDCYPLKTWGNTFDLHDKAFVQGASLGSGTIVDAIIGNQPDITEYDFGTGNKFTGTTNGNKFHLFSYNDDPENIPIYSYYTGSNPEPNIPQNSGAEQSLCTCDPINIQPNSIDLNSFYTCDQPIPDLGFNFDNAEAIIDGSFRSDFDDELLDWELKKDLYYFLKKYPVYTESNVDLENFVDTTEGSAIGKFYEVDVRMSALADTSLGLAQKELYRLEAISTNNSVGDDFIFETNQKDYNELFLSIIAAGKYTLTSTQQSDLNDIAEQCPYHGGRAVFLARGWYTSIDHEAAYDDAGICDPSPKVGTNVGHHTAFQLYPTITAGQVFLNTMEDVEDMVIAINNTLGQVVQLFPVSGITTAIDMAGLPTGVYHVFILKNKQIVFAEKVVKVSQ